MSEAKVTWASLPRKDQLLILFLVRFCEPIVKVSISAYVYFQLQWLDPSLPSAKVVQQVTLLQAAYTVAQGLASMFLGTIADSPRGGRKFVVVMSLFGSCMFFFSLFFLTSSPFFLFTGILLKMLTLMLSCCLFPFWLCGQFQTGHCPPFHRRSHQWQRRHGSHHDV